VKQYIHTKNAPTPGSYSQGVLVNEILYLSGQTANDINLKDEAVVEGGVYAQTRQCLNNLLEVVKAAGGNASSFIRLIVLLKDSGTVESRQSDWKQYNTAYSDFFKSHGVVNLPARAQFWPVDVPWAIESSVVEIYGEAEIRTKRPGPSIVDTL
jgi:2-iminobutanoate/2-iminopropanoate deaminase